ncbi:MAG: MCE family protein [Candidatus Latescibacterota bacterium]|nr:MAG: MCE family protein [Candidatus Latescibacterota bacterium]
MASTRRPFRLDRIRSWGPAVLVLMLLVGCARQPQEDLHVSVRFHTASNLEVGADVRVGKLRVGEVQSIDIDSANHAVVAAVIEAQYRDKVTSDAQFQIKRESLVSSTRYVELQPGKEKPIATDEPYFIGETNWLDLAQQWADQTKEWVTSEEVRDALRDFADAAGDAASQGLEEWQTLKPGLEEKARALYEMAREKAPAVAERLREEIDKRMEETEKELNSRSEAREA